MCQTFSEGAKSRSQWADAALDGHDGGKGGKGRKSGRGQYVVSGLSRTVISL
jgi:hypothetical protein